MAYLKGFADLDSMTLVDYSWFPFIFKKFSTNSIKTVAYVYFMNKTNWNSPIN